MDIENLRKYQVVEGVPDEIMTYGDLKGCSYKWESLAAFSNAQVADCLAGLLSDMEEAMLDAHHLKERSEAVEKDIVTMLEVYRQQLAKRSSEMKDDAPVRADTSNLTKKVYNAVAQSDCSLSAEQTD